MSWLDIVIVGLLVITVIVGLKKGLVIELFSLLSIILGVIIASKFYQKLGFLSGIVKNQSVEKVLTFLLLFIAVIVLVNLLGIFLSKIFKWSSLGLLDHLGGFLFGFIKGIIIIGIILFFLAKFPPMLKIVNQSPVASAILRVVNDTITLLWNKPVITEYI